MSKEGKLNLREFPRTFWIANVLELFERGAYYGMNAVLAIYLTDKLHFAEEAAGFIQAIVYALTYVFPIIGGALAEKYGYRRILMVAFSFLTFGYFATGHVDSYGLVFGSLSIMAVGSGLFKPIISGTIARTTSEKNSGFGFGIYYWMINLGAFLFPIIAGQLKLIDWKYVFMMSSLSCALMFIPVIFFYKDPELPGKAKSFKETASNAAMVLGDSRFMFMLFIYSCFWILYFQNFGSVLWYLRDYIDPTAVNQGMTSFLNTVFGWIPNILHMDPFNFVLGPEHVTVVNAGTIILLQVIISRIVKNFKALPVMSIGIIIGSCGFLILALTSDPWLFLVGIGVFSIGEMTTHPKYYSYVGTVAPQDKKAIYLGYAFLYGVIGSLFGSNFGAVLYAEMVKPENGEQGNPTLFFFILFVLGLLAFLGLRLFDKYFSEDTPDTQRKARKYVTGIYSLLILAGIGIVVWKKLVDDLSPKTIIQASIIALLGIGGLLITYKSKKAQQN
ncbi:MAG: MFS transporter [Acidobacteria bacterium]|nr:MFS transporter [Acidobacteriota bacterium]